MVKSKWPPGESGSSFEAVEPHPLEGAIKFFYIETGSFRLVLEGKTDKEIPESSRLEFLEKFLANNIGLSDAEDNTPRLLNRGGIADLPLLRTLLAVCQKFREPSFWKVTDCFILVPYASLGVQEPFCNNY